MPQRDIPPPLRPAQRVPPERFHLPVDRIRAGYYSDKYFLRTRDVLFATHRNPRVTMQVFQKQAAWLGGVDEAIAVLKLCLTDGCTWSDIEVLTLRDGDHVAPRETVMLITGPYVAFAHLETVYLGVLARRTRVATNTRLVVEAAWPKPVMFFPARFDHWLVQTGDGYAAHIAGAIGVSTDAQASWWGSEGIGTVPHSLIAAYGGDTAAATLALAGNIPEQVSVITLVDFDNDCVGTSLEVARALGPRLFGVRLDTSESMVDRSIVPQMGAFDPRGVNAQKVSSTCRSPFLAASIPPRSGSSKTNRFRWIRTGSVRRFSPDATTSPPTSSWSTAHPWRRPGAAICRIHGSSGSSRRGRATGGCH
jgi:nicotinate phosphoribosyltransferase